jgi:hypothetical protein
MLDFPNALWHRAAEFPKSCSINEKAPPRVIIFARAARTRWI